MMRSKNESWTADTGAGDFVLQWPLEVLHPKSHMTYITFEQMNTCKIADSMTFDTHGYHIISLTKKKVQKRT